eukprot:CAMPEP_0172327218 /NCGR_PEP_ID=MMETSP1058-20130122/58961_1 /TAXON_ID=83371 /ORGANISM="Detonula confervacea, Strain CCMP 353" /LENGTH=96 /DNA_ID=CAMNT_0013044209 /DNA_START=137 /DNA_END=424 /DNA_ORIENTATION=+
MACLWQALVLSTCLADRGVRMMGMPRCALVSLQMSSLRQGNKRPHRSSSFKKLSSLSSTPFPTTAAKPKRQTRHHYNATSWSNDFMHDGYNQEDDS